ncbi:hypothetical protein MMC20_000185 [Loxospora ochrophaea]|nr:hypothetical protein [Loxospora ochrophaea]
MPTIPSKRKKSLGGGVGMKGIVSAMGMNVEGVLAAGTWSRWLGLYDGQGGGGTIGIFEIGREGDGTGISQLLWSDCGRYLCVVERGSDGVGVWDVRGTGKRLCWLAGRKARTNQRLAVDRIGKEIWSGGQDGCVRVWEDLGMKEGTSEASWGFKAHDDAVSSAGVHPSGSVLATSSGQRHPTAAEPDGRDLDSGSEDDFLSTSYPKSEPLSVSNQAVDNSLKTTALKSIKSLAPLLDRILVQRIKAESKTAGGIFLPESSVKELNEAKVLAVGPGGLDKEGKRIAPSVAPGDKVLIPQYGGSAVKVGDEEYSLFRDHELLAKINE